MSAANLYRQILDLDNTDAHFIANVIINGSRRPAGKLKNLLAILKNGQDVRCGNEIDSLRVSGGYYSLGMLDGKLALYGLKEQLGNHAGQWSNYEHRLLTPAMAAEANGKMEVIKYEPSVPAGSAGGKPSCNNIF